MRSADSRGLRIAHVLGYFSVKYGGVEKIIVSLARECRRRGHRLYCVWEKPPISDQFNQDLRDARAQFAFFSARGSRGRFLAQMTGWLYRNHIDVMHSHFNPACVLALAAARLARVPLPLCSVHSGLEERVIADLSVRSRLVARVRRSLAARVMPVSQTVLDQYERLRLGGRSMRVHYLGVPLGRPEASRQEVRAELGLRHDLLVIACIAFHNRVKGLDILLQALCLLAPRFSGLRLLQIGSWGSAEDRSESERLKRLTVELGIADRVIWLGHRSDVNLLLQAADVYCQPSRSEGLPLAILEAMNASLPVVASRVGGIHEAVKDGQTGLLTEPESPARLADALQILIQDADLRARMGAQGEQVVRRQFDLQARTAALVDEYEEMIHIIRES